MRTRSGTMTSQVPLIANVQRGLNGHPGGRLKGGGIAPLTAATRQLPRVLVQAALGPSDAHAREQLDGAQACRFMRQLLVQADRLDDLVADRVHRAEGGHRLLENEPDLAATDLADLLAVG